MSSGYKWKIGSSVYWSEVKWDEMKEFGVMILSEMYLLSLIYSYVAVYMFCAVRSVVIIIIIIIIIIIFFS